MDSDPISARYAWNAGEMAEALDAHRRASIRPVFRVLLYLLIAFYAVGSAAVPLSMILSEGAAPTLRRNGVIGLIVAGVFWSWFTHAVRTNKFLKWQARRIFRSKGKAAEWVEWTIGPEELSVQTALTSSTILWPLFVRLVESPKGFMLYQSIQLFQWLPGHAFASESELRRFAELARSRVANTTVLGECRFPAKPGVPALDEI